MNIIQIYEASPRAGGIQVHASTLIKSLENTGNKVYEFPVPPLYLAKQNGIQRIASILKNSSKIFNQAIKLININRSNPDINVIHVHGPRIPLILGYTLSKISKKPLIITMHHPRALTNKYNPLWKKANRIITISKEIMYTLLKLGGDERKIVYIPNMVEAEQQDSPEVMENNVLFMGRLHPIKIGILKILLKATPQIIEQVPDARILIVGPDGSSRKEIENIVSELNQRIGKNAVSLIGYTLNPEEYRNKSKVIVGEARVAIESMMKGKPTIAGFTMNEEYFTGDLVTEKNIEKLEKSNFTGVDYDKKIDPNKLSKLITDILMDKSYTKEAAEYNRSYIMNNFENIPVTKKILSTYNEAILAKSQKFFKRENNIKINLNK